jgi:hypothetical protein
MGDRIIAAWAGTCWRSLDNKKTQAVVYKRENVKTEVSSGSLETIKKLHGVQGVASSNPATPTREINGLALTRG